LLTVFDVAAILRVKPQTVRRMAALGQLAYYRLNGKEFRFRKSDVEDLLVRTRVEPRSA
jgi:excisionase family DNA binding protein